MNLVKQVPKTQVREVPKQVGTYKGTHSDLQLFGVVCKKVGVPVFQCRERVVEAKCLQLCAQGSCQL